MSPDTQEIARDEWHPFFDAFSGMHRGWRVTLEVRGADLEPEVMAAQVPLEEIAAELGTKADERINIVLRPTSEAEISHVVEAPVHVWLRGGEGELDASLEIESARGTTTLVRFSQGGELERPTEDFLS